MPSSRQARSTNTSRVSRLRVRLIVRTPNFLPSIFPSNRPILTMGANRLIAFPMKVIIYSNLSGTALGVSFFVADVVEPLRGQPGFIGKAPGGLSRWSTMRSGEWQSLQAKLVCANQLRSFFRPPLC